MSSRAFSACPTARALVVTAVGAALAALTAGAFSFLEGASSGVVIGVPTLLVGLVWAGRMSGASAPHATFAWRPGLSVPLAIVNASVSAGLLLATGSTASAFDLPSFCGGVVMGALAFAVWGPCLAVTLLVFGLPLARAHTLARRGLDGEDRGRTLVGAVCATVGLLVLVLGLSSRHTTPGIAHLVVAREGLVAAGRALTAGLASCAVVAGGLGVALAEWRRAKRDTLLADVAAGTRSDYRVELSANRRVLVRVETTGHAYRASDVAEEVYVLDSHTDEQPRASLRT